MKVTYSSYGGGGGGGTGSEGRAKDSRLDVENPKSWPPGFRFHPSDEELILYYLKRKICRKSLKLNVIKETDVYKWHPEELPDQSILKSGDREWYFFTPRDRKYRNGARSSRATMHGYWKATGKDRAITWNSRSVGVKKTLVFYKGRAPAGERTDWVMHEYTMEENELQRCKDVKDYYALYRVFKKSGPGPKNGEQYGAPFREEDWTDDDDEVENNTSKEGAQVPQNSSALVDTLSNKQCEPLVNELDELYKEFAEELEENPLPNDEVGYVPPQCDAHGSFAASQSAVFCRPSCEAFEVASASNFSERDFHANEGENYLETDDLLGPEQHGISDMIIAGDNSWVGEIDGLLESDCFFDASLFLEDMGNINGSFISDPYNDSLRGDLSTFERPPELCVQDERFNLSARAELNTLATTPTLASADITHGAERQDPNDNENVDVDSWCTAAISAFLGSVPTSPALASENVLTNPSFEGMSNFGRARIAAIGTSRRPVAERRVSRNGGFLFFSVLGLVCAVSWMLVIGTMLKILKYILGRFISS